MSASYIHSWSRCNGRHSRALPFQQRCIPDSRCQQLWSSTYNPEGFQVPCTKEWPPRKYHRHQSEIRTLQLPEKQEPIMGNTNQSNCFLGLDTKVSYQMKFSALNWDKREALWEYNNILHLYACPWCLSFQFTSYIRVSATKNNPNANMGSNGGSVGYLMCVGANRNAKSSCQAKVS